LESSCINQAPDILCPIINEFNGGDLARDFICGQNNIVTNIAVFSCIYFLGNNVDMNSSMSFRKVGAAFFKCIDKKNTVDAIVIYLITKWCKKQLVTEAKP
jgi:hypothetical protein